MARASPIAAAIGAATGSLGRASGAAELPGRGGMPCHGAPSAAVTARRQISATAPPGPGGSPRAQQMDGVAQRGQSFGMAQHSQACLRCGKSQPGGKIGAQGGAALHLEPLLGWSAAKGAQSPDQACFPCRRRARHAAPCRLRPAPAVPRALLADRLAFSAAQASQRMLGRPEVPGDLRDAVHLLRPGEAPGPAGGLALTWRRAGSEAVQRQGRGAASPLGGAAAAPERELTARAMRWRWSVCGRWSLPRRGRRGWTSIWRAGLHG